MTEKHIMLKNFLKNLTQIKEATLEQRKKEIWDVEGILHGFSNQILKFDLRPHKEFKTGFFKSIADKIVFENGKEWIVFDVGELHPYLKNNNIKDVYIHELVKELDYTIIIEKN